MEKLTELKALKLCEEMWTILRDKKFTSKFDAKSEMGFYKDALLHTCFFCEYAMQQTGSPLYGIMCPRCPGLKLWPEYCSAPRAIYTKWLDAVSSILDNPGQENKYAKKVKKAAENKIIDFCKERSSELKKKRSKK